MSFRSSLFSFKRSEAEVFFDSGLLFYRCSLFVLLCSPSIPVHRNYGKLLIVISRKVGKSVLRNKIRRRIKEIFFKNKIYKVFSGSFCLICRKGIAESSFGELEAELLRAFSKGRLKNRAGSRCRR